MQTWNALSVLAASVLITVVAHAQDPRETTTSFDGPPRQVDENSVPEGVGFNQSSGGELSATALEQAAIGTASVRYHYYGTGLHQNNTLGAQYGQAPAAAGVAQTNDAVAGQQPVQGAPTAQMPAQPVGYAQQQFITPISNPTNTSWHLYRGPITGMMNTNAGPAASNVYHINGNAPEATPGGPGYGRGSLMGHFAPYAAGGNGFVFGCALPFGYD
jgi:hypothetical protein